MRTYKYKNSLLVIRLCFVFIIGTLYVTASAQFAGGDGSEGNPWQVANAEQLNNVRNYLGNDHNDKHFIQTANINLGAAPWNEGEGWLPIGDNVNYFKGHYNGANHTINGLSINRAAADYQGLFGYALGARIQNLKLEAVNIQGRDYVGSLIGYGNEILIFKIYMNGQIIGNNSVGGLIGETGLEISYIYQSYTVGSVTGDRYIGGLIGYQRFSEVTDCYSRAAATGNSYTGGFVGYINHANGSIHNCYSTGLITGQGNYFGGLIGRLSSAIVIRSYWDIESSGRLGSAGGVGLTTAEMQIQNTYKYSNFYSLWEINEGNDYPVFQDLSNYALPQPMALTDIEGEGTLLNPYLITNADELNAIRLDLTAHYLLNDDIDLRSTVIWDFGRGWEPVGTQADGSRFAGTLDGGGYSITGLQISRPKTDYQGLFGYVQEAVIHNLNLQDAYIQGWDNVGSFIGFAEQVTSFNISSRGLVLGNDNVGGLIGNTGGTNSTIHMSHSSGFIMGRSSLGGLIGTLRNVEVVNCYSNVSVFGSSLVGGLTGLLDHTEGSIHNCYSTGLIEGGGNWVGGFLGRHISGTIRRCYWDIEASSRVNSHGGTDVVGKNTTEMKSKETYSFFNFNTQWEIDEGNDYPVFQDLSAYSLPQFVALTDLEGEGTVQNPYIVTNANELNAIRQDLTAHYLLGGNIDLSSTTIWNYGGGWEPVGTSSDENQFTGTFDGTGFMISNLHISRPKTNYQGLFGYAQNATLQNISFKNIHIQAWDNVGSLLGYGNQITVFNIHSQGEILGNNSVSSLIGETGTGNSTVYLSYSEGYVIGYSYLGGLIGIQRNTEIVDCYSRASVSGNTYAGGLVGFLNHANGLILCSYSTGLVVATGTYSNGFIGRVLSGSVNHCFWDIESSQKTSSGGGHGVEGKTTEEMLSQETYRYFNFHSLWQIDEGNYYPVFQDLSNYSLAQTVDLTELEGEGTNDNPYIITNSDELNAVRQGLTAHYVLGNDIDLSRSVIWDYGRGWEPIGSTIGENFFTGSFDGAGYRISNLHLSRPSTNYLGLFGYGQGATIKNLTLKDVNIRGLDDVGSILGYGDQITIYNSRTNGDIIGNNRVGGLIGSTGNNSSIIHQSYSTGNIVGESNVGGLVGYLLNAEIVDCYSRAAVSGRTLTGGLVGYVNHRDCVVQNSYSTGLVLGTGTYIGGFIGRLSSGSVTRCYWDRESSGRLSSHGGAGVMGRTTEQMTYPNAENTYENWDIEDIWSEDEEDSMNDGYLFLKWQGSIHPHIAANPQPEHQSTGVSVNLEQLNWSYIEHTYFMNPIGFKVYFNTTGEFGEEDDFAWVNYVVNQEAYSTSAVLPEQLEYFTTYYWKVVPTTLLPERDGNKRRRLAAGEISRNSANSSETNNLIHRGDAEECPVWSFRTEQYPNPVAAINPVPANDTLNVSIEPERLQWDYVINPRHINPLGFRVYINETGEFGEQDDYDWVAYIEDQIHYSSSAILPEQYEYFTDYYWKVVPTTIEPERGIGDRRRSYNETDNSRQNSNQENLHNWLYRGDAEDCPVWSFKSEKHPDPIPAVNPIPANDSLYVEVNLERLSWEYIVNPIHSNPLGFRVYLNTTGNFGEEDEFDWVPYVDEQNGYSSTAVLPERLAFLTTYYWQVIPTTIEPERNGSERRRRNTADNSSRQNTETYLNNNINRGDATDIAIWKFKTRGDLDPPDVVIQTIIRDGIPYIRLEWEAVNEASYYAIYYSADAFLEFEHWEVVDIVDPNQYEAEIETENRTLFYRVLALREMP